MSSKGYGISAISVACFDLEELADVVDHVGTQATDCPEIAGSASRCQEYPAKDIRRDRFEFLVGVATRGGAADGFGRGSRRGLRWHPTEYEGIARGQALAVWSPWRNYLPTDHVQLARALEFTDLDELVVCAVSLSGQRMSTDTRRRKLRQALENSATALSVGEICRKTT